MERFELKSYYEDLSDYANSIQEYIVDSEMGGNLDKTDSFYPTYQALDDLKQKFEEEHQRNFPERPEWEWLKK